MNNSATRVLVVDDERFFREAISEALESAGIESVKVSNGEEALKAVEDHGIGVVVLDIGLAGMSGIEVLERMRVLRPLLRVIVLSGASDQESVLEALRLDACDYLAKPLHDEELVLVVRRAMAGYGVEARGDNLRQRLWALRAEMAALADSIRSGERSTREELADGIAQATAKVVGATKSSLMLPDESGEVLRVVGAVGGIPIEEMTPVQIGEPVAGLAVANGEPVFANDVTTDIRFAGRLPRDRYRTGSFAIAPLDGGGDLLGALCVTDREGQEPFDEDDIALLRILALLASQMLAQFFDRSGRSVEPTSEEVAENESADGSQAAGAEGQTTLLEAEGLPLEADAGGGAVDDSEVARQICEAITSEIEPMRLIEAALQPVATHLGASLVSLYLLDTLTGDLTLEGQALGASNGDRGRLSRTRGLTAAVLQTGRLVATDHPESDPRFDPDMDTPEEGAVGPLLCVPMRLRGKVMGVVRVFPEDGAKVSARSGEVISAALSAAVRNVLLYRSLLESIDEVAKARQSRGAA